MFTEVFRLALANAEPQRWPTYDGLELDRTEFLTSSETANCLRMAFFKKHPEQYPPKVGNGTNGFADRGHAIEAWLVAVLKPLEKLGYIFTFMGKDQRSFYDADLGISGTPDGLMRTPDGRLYMLEIKSIDPRFNKNNLPKTPHIWQTQQNMFLVQHCLNVKLDGAILFYIDASNVHDVKEFPMVYDEEMVQRSFDRADQLWAAEKPEDLEPDGIYTGDCEYCPATQHCSQTVNMQNVLAKLQEKPSPFLAGETESLNDEQRMQVEQWFDAYDGVKQYSQQKDDVHADVQRLVVSYNGYVEVDGRGILSRTQAGRETIDRKALEADGIDVSKYTKQGAPFVVLTVKDNPHQ